MAFLSTSFSLLLCKHVFFQDVKIALMVEDMIEKKHMNMKNVVTCGHEHEKCVFKIKKFATPFVLEVSE